MQFWNRQDYIHQDVFLFLPSCEPRQCQPDFLWYFVEVCCFIQLKIHQKFKFAEIPRTFHLQNDKNKSNLLILLKYFVKFPVRQSISCEQSSQVHGEKDGLIFILIWSDLKWSSQHQNGLEMPQVTADCPGHTQRGPKVAQTDLSLVIWTRQGHFEANLF